MTGIVASSLFIKEREIQIRKKIWIVVSLGNIQQVMVQSRKKAKTKAKNKIPGQNPKRFVYPTRH